MELLTLSLVLSFIFSFGIFLVGIWRKDMVFSLIGSILLMIFSIVCIITGTLGEGTQMIHMNITNSTGSQLNVFNITKDNSIDETITFSFGIVAFIFSALLFLYTVWSQKNRGAGEEE